MCGQGLLYWEWGLWQNGQDPGQEEQDQGASHGWDLGV